MKEKNITNHLVKVYSHQRSGTNYLMAMLAHNFFHNVNLKTAEDPDRSSNFYDEHGNTAKFNKWGKLFGGHKPRPLTAVEIKRAIYIKRDPLDTAYSVFMRKDMLPGYVKESCKTFDHFIQMDIYQYDMTKWRTIVDQIKWHHDYYRKMQLFTVLYEDLLTDEGASRWMFKIARYFNLQFCHDEIVFQHELVGWDPHKGVKGLGNKNNLQ